MIFNLKRIGEKEKLTKIFCNSKWILFYWDGLDNKVDSNQFPFRMLASLCTFHQRSEAHILCKFESHQFLSFTHAVGENLSNNSYDISRVGNYQHFQGYFHRSTL